MEATVTLLSSSSESDGEDDEFMSH
jgi:hypothetical protein